MTDNTTTQPATTELGGDPPAPQLMTIAILSPCTIGVDTGDDLDVDLATVVDPYGLPYLPKYRLSARLRDAALTVLSEAGTTTEDWATAEQLLGASYSTADTNRLLVTGHAQLPRPVQAAAVAAITEHKGRYPNSALRRNIHTALTTTIRRTARDDRGAPIPGSLREISAIVPGVVLEAPLHWTAPPTAAHIRFLARCILTLTQIGLGASDDGGRVDCAIDGNRPATAALAFAPHDEAAAR